MIESEDQLAGVAAALIGPDMVLPRLEQRLVDRREAASPELVATFRRGIEAGGDPLGDVFCALRSPEERREDGATYTPPAIVASMIAWAQRQSKTPVRIVDPGAGSGRFTIAAARAFPNAELIAVEIDPLARLLLRANAAVIGFADRLFVRASDFRRISLPATNGPTLFIGNPPYVRHHQISERWKDWFGKTATALGFRASKLAGLHIHFFLKTRSIGRPGDFGAFITAAEWIDVNYGSVLRQMLANGLGGASLHVISPDARPFADALTTGAITAFNLGERPDRFLVDSVDSVESLADLSSGSTIEWATLEEAPRWSIHIRKGAKPAPGHIELGDLFRVHRGQVSGANGVWIAGPQAEKLPKRYLLPCITKARDLLEAGATLEDASGLRRVVDLPRDLNDLEDAERDSVERFLVWARKQGAHESYVARHRRAWWSVGLKDPAPILCTYMARRAPGFVRNACGARHLNIAHGLYPREPLDDATLSRLVAYLSKNVCINSGRIYAGGLAKFEPGEVSRLPVPSPDRLPEFTVQ
ncbi:Eco57I restriction-modification methylase domain-containing protein [Ruegeria atlantica]|uniref:Eco57I restriction-modification methylase domain-containing protein n=1 Tax=Ruegeria atlantica TaxID=81569 RepID=UPI001479F7AE|nr:class I SAM-dependent methyltransferase [Ruegeria atlantica]